MVAGDLAFPARLASVTTLSDPTGAPTGDGPALRQRVVVNPALFETLRLIANGGADAIIMTTSTGNLTVDFGTVGVTIDADGDGVQDSGEPGLSGISLRLYRDANNDGIYETLVDTVTTDGAGNYIFDGLSPDDYQVVGNGGVRRSHAVW